MFLHSKNPSHLFQSDRRSVFSRANSVVFSKKGNNMSAFAAVGLEFHQFGFRCARQMTDCAVLCSREGCGMKHNQKQSGFFSVDLSVCDALVSEGSSVHPKPARKFHLLCGFVVAGTGHVGYVGRYGLDLPHELISNPGVVLQQCH